MCIEPLLCQLAREVPDGLLRAFADDIGGVFQDIEAKGVALRRAQRRVQRLRGQRTKLAFDIASMRSQSDPRGSGDADRAWNVPSTLNATVPQKLGVAK